MTLISTHFQDQKVSENQNQILNLLQESSNRSSEILNEFTSENTKKAFLGSMMYWKAWLSAVGLNFESKHKPSDILRCFILQHMEFMDPIDHKLFEQGLKAKLGTHSLATIKRRIGQKAMDPFWICHTLSRTIR